MSIDPDAIHVDTRVGVVAARLARRPGQPVVVVDSLGRLLGALIESDLVRARSSTDTCAELLDGEPQALDAGTALDQVLQEGLPRGNGVWIATHQGRAIGTLGPRDMVRIAQLVLPADLRVHELAPSSSFVQVESTLDPLAVRARMAVSGCSLAVVALGRVPIAVMHEDEIIWAIRSGQDPWAGAERRIVFPVSLQAPVRRAAHDLIRSRSRALPVLGTNGEIVAVLTLEDLVRAAYEGLGHMPRSAVA